MLIESRAEARERWETAFVVLLMTGSRVVATDFSQPGTERHRVDERLELDTHTTFGCTSRSPSHLEVTWLLDLRPAADEAF